MCNRYTPVVVEADFLSQCKHLTSIHVLINLHHRKGRGIDSPSLPTADASKKRSLSLASLKYLVIILHHCPCSNSSHHPLHPTLFNRKQQKKSTLASPMHKLFSLAAQFVLHLEYLKTPGKNSNPKLLVKPAPRPFLMLESPSKISIQGRFFSLSFWLFCRKLVIPGV